jgi:hypothetical protein
VIGGSVLGGDVSAVVDLVDSPVVPDDGVVAAVVVAAIVVAGPVVGVVAAEPPPPTDSWSFLSEQAAAMSTPAMSAAPTRFRRRRADVLVIPTKFPLAGCGCCGPRVPNDTSVSVVTPVTGPGRH